jgi:hypothetical protein
MSKHPVLRRIMKVFGVLVVLYAAVSGLLFAAMKQSPDDFAQTMKHVPWAAMVVLPFEPLWDVARAGRVGPGDAAPDFALESPDHKTRFQLSSIRGQRPAVLVFGSYT